MAARFPDGRHRRKRENREERLWQSRRCQSQKARKKAKKAQKTTEADETAEGCMATGADQAEAPRAEERKEERKLSFLVKTCLPDLTEFRLEVPDDTRMVDFRAMLTQKLCAMAAFHSLCSFSRIDIRSLSWTRHANPRVCLRWDLVPSQEMQHLSCLRNPSRQRAPCCRIHKQRQVASMRLLRHAHRGNRSRCKQSDAGMSCFLSTLSMFKRLVSNELLRRRTANLGSLPELFRRSPPAVAALHAIMAGRPRTLRPRDKAVLSSSVFLVLSSMLPDLERDKVFEHSRLLFSMLLNHAADSDEGKEQWRVIDLKSLDAEMEVDWLQRAEEQTAEQDSGVPLMGRAWFLKRAPWLHAAWADCGEVAFWRLDINGAERVWGLGLSLVTRELNLKPDPGKAEPQTVHGRLLGFPSPISSRASHRAYAKLH